jgi:hypothetical protein
MNNKIILVTLVGLCLGMFVSGVYAGDEVTAAIADDAARTYTNEMARIQEQQERVKRRLAASVAADNPRAASHWSMTLYMLQASELGMEPMLYVKRSVDPFISVSPTLMKSAWGVTRDEYIDRSSSQPFILGLRALDYAFEGNAEMIRANVATIKARLAQEREQ